MKTVLPPAIRKVIGVRLGVILLLLFSFHSLSYSQANCAGAVQLIPAVACNPTAGTMNGAVNSGVAKPVACTGAANITYDEWYYFQATSTNPTITMVVTGARFQNQGIQLLTGTCATLANFNCKTGNAGTGTVTYNVVGLTIGTIYYIRLYSTSATLPSNNANGAYTICVTGPPPPANDDCLNAVSITSGAACTNTVGSVINATPTAGVPAACVAATYDVWYSFTAQSTNPIISLSGQGANFTNSNVQLFSGTCAALTSLGCGTAGIMNSTGLTVGNTYFVRVYSTTAGAPPTTAGAFSICVVDPPANDLCAGAITLTPGATCSNTLGTIEYSTLTTGASTTCATATYDVWYKFTATSTNPIITLSGQQANFTNSNIQLFSGNCAALTSIGCGTAGVLNSTGLTIGNTYYVRVYSTTAGASPGVNGDFNICVVDPPANDLCANAITLTPGSSCTNTVGTVVYSTVTAGTPAPCSGTVAYDVWYKFVATSTNPIITLSGLGANFTNSNVQLFSGTCAGLTSLGCGTAGVFNSSGLTIGSTYFVRIYSTSAGSSPTTLGGFSVCVVDPPVNDICSGAIALTPGSSCAPTTGTIVNATTTAGDPGACSGTVTYDVWYKFVAGAAAPTIQLSNFGANFTNPNVQLFSGACGSLGSLGCGTLNGTTYVINASSLTIGSTYYLRVYSTTVGSAPTSAGNFDICVVNPPANDDCAGAITLTPGSATCTTTAGTVNYSSLSTSVPGICAGTAKYDVWYKFVATSTNPLITLGGLGVNFVSSGMQLLSGACGSQSSISCGTSSIQATGLTIGTTYYVRVYSSGVTSAPIANGDFTICVTDPPANDLCANAVTLVSSNNCTTTAGNVAYSTFTAGTLAGCAGTVVYDVWYKFVAASTYPTITLSSVGVNFVNPAIQIFSGTCAGFASLACATGTSLVTSGLTIGTTYYVRVYSTTGSAPTSTATFNICITDPPANDDCANAVTLTSAGTCVTTAGTIVSANLSTAPAPSCGTPTSDVWYKFVAQTPNPTITMGSLGANFTSPGIQILSGACGSQAQVSCALGSTLTASGLTAGTTYYVRIFSTSAVINSNGTFTICVTDPPPANDNCAGAITLSSSTTCTNTVGTVIGSTLTGAVPAPSCGTPVTYDVWYQFVAQSTTPTITLSSVGVGFTTPSIQVLSGACGALANVGANCSTTGTLAATGLTIGTTYYVRIFSKGTIPTTNGSFNICITDPLPTNDNCAGAITLTSGTTCTNTGGSVSGATLTAGIPVPACGTPTYDVWYSFVAQTSNPTITLSSLGSNFTNAGIQILSGACGSLVNVSCVTGNAITASGLTAGTTYYIRVYSTGALPTSNGNFNICVTDPAPSNDDCAGAVTLTSGGTCVNTAGTVIGATLTSGVVAPTCGAPVYDVWYKFVAQTINPTITLSSLGANFINPHIQLLSGACGSLVNVGANCSASATLAATGLVPGTTYYIRVYSTSAVPTTSGSFNICITDPAPANDNCAGAVALTSGTTCTNTAGNMVGASLTGSIPVPACGTPTYDVWYSFVAQTANPTITLSSLGSNFTNAGIQILSGACGSLVNVSCATGNTITASGLTAGTTYYIRVYSTGTIPTSNGTFNICVTDPAPANDDCAGAVTLTSGSTCVNTTGTVIGSTLTSGVVAPTCGVPVYDIWYKFVAQTVNPTITLSSLGVNFINPHIQLLSGACGSLVNVGTNCTATSTLAATGLVPGTTYYIRVYSTTAVPTSAGSFNICITDPAPANDNCAGAVVLTSGATCTNTAGNMISASLTGGVPAPSCGTPTYDIWYSFVAQTPNPTITLSSLGSNFTNAGIQILSGACGSLVDAGCATGNSITASGLVAGTTYYIRVYSTGTIPTSNGTFNICVTDPAPANDDCAGAVTLTSGSSCVNIAGTVIGATLTSGVVLPTCGTPIYDVWYKFVAQTVNPTITLSSLGVNFINPHIQLLSGACGSLVNVGTNCSAAATLVATGLVPGTTYYVRVYSTTAVPTSGGSFNICITDPAAANDNCAGAITLTPGTTCTNTAGNMAGATLTAGVPVPSCGTPTYDVWYSFVTPIANPTITLSSLGSNFTNAGIQILSGVCGALVNVSCATGNSITASGLTPGTTYYIRVYSTGTIPTSNGTFNICVTVPAPANDDCTGAITLTSGTTCTNTSGTVIGSTLSAGVPAPSCGTPVTYDVWYQFVAQSINPTITLSSVGVGFTTPSLQLLSGSCGSLANAGANCSTTGTLAATGLTIGTTYYVRVFSKGTIPTANGGFNICITDPVVANDNCAGAITLTSFATCTNTIGNFVGSSLSTGFPAGCAGTATYDVWFKFVAQAVNPTITLSSLGINASGANMQLLSGACGTQTSLACGTTSLTASGLTLGTTYYIRVYSAGPIPTSGGSFNICVTDPPPTNDDCSGAISITSGSTCTTTTGNVYASTLSAGVPVGCAGAVTYDMWYSFVAKSTNPTVTLGSVGANFTNPHIQLFSGTCGSLTSLVCGTTTVTASALTVGSTYYVRIYSTGAIPTSRTNTGFTVCVTDLAIATVDFGKSYVNITKGTVGGTIEPGDVLEIRAVFVVKANTAYGTSFTDNIPANTTYIPGTLKIQTNEGKLYKALTDAAGDDAGSIVGGVVTINLGSTATAAAGGNIKNTDKPSFYNSTAIVMATYRITVNAANAYLTKIGMGLGTVTYQSTNGGTPMSIVFPKDTVMLYNNYGICANTVGTNGILSEFGGTFGSGKNKNRFASSKVPTNYTDTILGTGTPQDYYYGVTNNTSTGNATTPAGYSILNTWAYPDNSATTHRVFTLWDIIGDHTGAISPTLGNPAADTVNSSTGGYMVTINSSFKTDTAFLDTVKSLCPNTYYQYSAWFRNLCSKCSCDSNGHGAGVSVPAYIPTGPGDSSGVHPDLTFNINGYDYYTTGDIPYTGKWVQKGFTYKTGPNETQMIVNIRNNAPGGGGNDWAIDDIGVASCSPNTTLTPDKVDTLCMGADDTVRFKVSSYFNNYTQWELETSADQGATWSAAGPDTTGAASTGSSIPIYNSTTHQYEYTVLRYYRLNLVDTTVQYKLTVATASVNLNNPNCDFATTTSKVVRTFDCQYILPTKIVFRGQLKNGLANLGWTSSSEVANTLYIVQRSLDGVHYTDIGQVMGNSAATGYGQYSFIDPQPVAGRAYYRINITSSGYQKFSSVVLLSASDFALEIKSLINPFLNTISFDLIVPQDKAVTFMVTDSYGRKIKQQGQQVQRGVNPIRITGLDALQSGVYSLQVQYGDQILTRRVLKLEQ